MDEVVLLVVTGMVLLDEFGLLAEVADWLL